ncbi:type II toxin-antitoxin system RelE/ParE family toxin [Sporosalibacterium faouarense]|uniref:type II toxin-antitoxin system RelE/ParE family toxin n=1 Tax=Sporosalibacterium faouarense TaxID=516123 RepID=UPI00192C7EBC|nr:type II toxin-antitoxin system RelE/ParE family toxin [Sporosalibacterium faouarense]
MSKKYETKYLPIAERDLTEIIEYIQLDDPIAAIKFLDKIDSSISKLEEIPFIGKIPKDSRLEYLSYRILIIGNYLVFYVVQENTVEIRRILHGKRKYDFLF